MSERLDASFPGGKRVDIQVGEFTIATDQSVRAGGTASAPEPFALFLASMAACAGIYALNFCRSRDLSTKGLGLITLWERDEKHPLQATVRFRLTLPVGFPEKYRTGIAKAMDLCAVKKHIQNPPAFITEILD
ncbi:MAG: OsmC family protein [Pseudomonadota bacterium]|nr:OsmC family protein [Pseudomonadota bacterium]